MTYDRTPAFTCFGASTPVTPIILSVPHAGRTYPDDLLNASAVPVSTLHGLEDRYVDHVAGIARRHETLIVANRPRAWIDLNRAEWERDPQVDDGADPAAQPHGSAKVRGGLGLVPRRLGTCHMLWRRPFSADDIETRIAQCYRPYHQMLADMLHAALARFGTAILLDIHSMPPISAANAPRIVLGDRFGRSAGSRLVAAALMAAENHGYTTAVNSPYSGGYILDRHGAADRGIHAIQIEIDRATYLDSALDRPGPGLNAVATMVRAMIDAVSAEAVPQPLAAE